MNFKFNDKRALNLQLIYEGKGVLNNILRKDIPLLKVRIRDKVWSHFKPC